MSKSVFKDNILKGKTVLVTGGGTGIGFGICRILGLHGANVALASRRQNVIDEACEKLRKEGITCFGLTLDVRNEKICKEVTDKVVERFGSLDFLVNNAAGNFMSSIETLSLNGFKTVLDIDLVGSFNMCKAAFSHMKKNEKSCIINISATVHYSAEPFQIHASAAKAGIDVLTNTIGIEWGEYGIRCVSVAPGPIGDTVGGPDGRVSVGKESIFAMKVEEVMPIGRFGTVDDIGNMVLYLCSPAGEGITSTAFVVDGGHYHKTFSRYKAMKRAVQAKSSHEKQNFKGGVSKSKL